MIKVQLDVIRQTLAEGQRSGQEAKVFSWIMMVSLLFSSIKSFLNTRRCNADLCLASSPRRRYLLDAGKRHPFPSPKYRGFSRLGVFVHTDANCCSYHSVRKVERRNWFPKEKLAIRDRSVGQPLNGCTAEGNTLELYSYETEHWCGLSTKGRSQSDGMVRWSNLSLISPWVKMGLNPPQHGHVY